LNGSPSTASRGPRRRGLLGLAAVVGTILLVAATMPAATAAQSTAAGRKLTAKPLTGTRVQGAKSASGQLAETDKRLLGITSSKPENVVVKLDYDSLAAYRGDVKGYAATSPSVTGRRLDLGSAAARKYSGYVRGVENEFLGALRSRLPAADAGRSLRTVYGGVAVKVAGNRIADLLRLPGVAAVQKNTLQQPLTDASPAFIGAPTLYRQLGGSATAGRGVIVGVLDSGAWPEHPSYVDHGNLPAPPDTGTPRTCDFGDDPTTPASDVFVCNHKLISGQPFIDDYNELIGGEVYPDTARDSNGHGTHTSTTAVGGPVAQANPLGVDRGSIHGIAPGAHLAVYKVCGEQGCFSSDSAAAVAQAIADGVQVINFSISGGTNPFTDPVEMAFLDAYAAGVLVSTSAGNEGPGAGTVNHRGPWVTTVAASTQRRAFESTLTLAGGADTATLTGASITAGVAPPLPVVLSSEPPYSNELCSAPAAPGTFTGKIVGCLRGGGIARVAKGFNVLQGGAAGMILYNPPTQADVETDNHWLPTVHLNGVDGAAFTGFVRGHPGTTASFTAGQKVQGRGDVMADFSSRGPGGDWLKPDITAPGVQILAGMTPTPESTDLGPPGQFFQAIAGTSMSSPHIAGSAALLFARHPTWSPGQVKSALETTAKTAGVVKENGTTPADPFDFGGGRVDLNVAGNPGLTFDESAADYAAASVDVLGRIDLNTPSVNAPIMPGKIGTSRVARNVTGRTLRYTVTTEAPAGSEITVTPSSFTLAAGARIRLRIRISAPSLPPGQYFGRIDLDRRGGSDLHLPVAFNRTQGQVTLAQTCDPTTIALETGRSTCEVTVQNTSLQDTSVVSRSRLTSNLRLTAVDGAFQASPREVVGTANLAGKELASPTIAPGTSPAGYLPLDAFGATPQTIGDEDAINFSGLAAPFRFADVDYDAIGVTSNGYSVAGGVSSAAEIEFVPQTLPDPALPNSVLAPFWTDLDGTGAPGILAAELTDGVSTWLVIEWRVNVFGTTSLRVFQHWLGEGDAEDISFVYDPANLPAAPTAGFGLTVGAENQAGSAGDQIAPTTPETPPTEDLRVTSTPGSPGGTLAYSYELKGVATGVGEARTTMRTPLIRGATTDFDQITVTAGQ
jgi:Subtilase family/PA domain/Fibronectin type-III domain